MLFQVQEGKAKITSLWIASQMAPLHRADASDKVLLSSLNGYKTTENPLKEIQIDIGLWRYCRTTKHAGLDGCLPQLDSLVSTSSRYYRSLKRVHLANFGYFLQIILLDLGLELRKLFEDEDCQELENLEKGMISALN